ncbi:methyltransferase domain-containing protein [Candidatus Woesearchaeota archaeon]|nr:methyltransferase domain-containing protein [Candidatus Woesearchaeota archaeon]
MDKHQIKKQEENKRFFGNWAATYDFSLFQWWMRGFWRELKKSLILSKETKLLDISCGTGELLKELQGKAHLTGLDFSEEMLEKARKKLAKGVELKQADVHELPFKEDTFDIVISTEAFHHYYDQEKAIKEMMRVTKKGGKVMISDINFFSKALHYLFEKLEPGCVKVNSKKEMHGLFKKAGLKNITQKRSFIFAVLTIGEKS